jgi:glycosyltransferase involved in cell wall biosynthesis
MVLSIIIPVYNEGPTVSKLIDLVLEACEKLPTEISNFELVIVEDGSSDNTKEILENKYSDHSKISLYFQESNQGKGAAITRGFLEAKGSLIIIQDADMEYDPYDYPDLLTPIINNKADVVYGSRFKGNSIRVLYFWHSLGNKFLTLFSNMLTDLNLSDMETCYKVFRAPIIKNMILSSKRFGIEPEMTAKISKLKSIRIYEVPISYNGRTYADGKKIGWKDGFSAIWCIFKFNILCSKTSSFKVTPEQILKEL